MTQQCTKREEPYIGGGHGYYDNRDQHQIQRTKVLIVTTPPHRDNNKATGRSVMTNPTSLHASASLNNRPNTQLSNRVSLSTQSLKLDINKDLLGIGVS